MLHYVGSNLKICCHEISLVTTSLNNKSIQKVTVFVSNAPPHHLCQFLKAAVAKLAGGRGAPALTARKKLLSGLPQSLDGISPVTQKDVKNLKSAEAGGKGLLKINLASPVSSASGGGGDSKKRRRLVDDKEIIYSLVMFMSDMSRISTNLPVFINDFWPNVTKSHPSPNTAHQLMNRIRIQCTL